MTPRASQERSKRWARRVIAFASRVWTSDRLFFAALTLFNLFLARRTFGAGIWADNDSVCHYAYLRHLLEDILPATGTYLAACCAVSRTPTKRSMRMIRSRVTSRPISMPPPAEIVL